MLPKEVMAWHVQTLVNLVAVSNHRMDLGDFQRPPIVQLKMVLGLGPQHLIREIPGN